MKMMLLLPLGPLVPPAPSNVTAAHPLLVRHAEAHAVPGSLAARVHRAGRQRGAGVGTYRLHVHYNSATCRHPNPPPILQRLVLYFIWKFQYIKNDIWYREICLKTDMQR